MRPKVVLLILLFGAGVLVLAGVLHGLLNRQPAISPTTASAQSPVESVDAPPESTQTGAASAANTGVGSGAASIIATTPAEDRAAQRDKELEAISEALLSAENDLNAVTAIASRLESVHAEVRSAAREAAVHLGDTNVLPYLTAAFERISDPREKVDLMDAIEFLQLPSGADTQMPEGVDVVPPNPNSVRPGATNASGGIAPQSQPRQPLPRRSRSGQTPPQRSP